ncbi:uncharacterized protein LOC117505114 [Thalassophryne amazonica]|uniref:uncharacterized protein LOC117505114 n=1 Tax=Thalassophryne amazonica TaxID=390379 RepID=UPI001471DF1A|nr:uncharacterized protein LOC117505114 [Thalassophryne amazonica]
MNHNVGQFDRPTHVVIPPLSTRTLAHPSFLPLYMATAVACHHREAFNSQEVHPIIPAEFFYSYPNVGHSGRIPNIVSDLALFDCFQLNTPQPIMSPWPAQPLHPDPFRSGSHATRELGSTTWITYPAIPAVQPSRAILELTEEEDQAITNLLKLHHEPSLDLQTEKMNVVPFLDHFEPTDPIFAEGMAQPKCGDVQENNGPDTD